MNALAVPRRLELPAKLLPILEPMRFKILHGGRGGTKSHTVAETLLMLGSMRTLRIVCAREIQKSLAQSSMQVLKDYIDKLGLSAYYEVLKTEIRGFNGTQFTFTGLRDHTVDSFKSNEGADIVWIEEAAKVSAHSWNIVLPTVRKPGSEIWATFNPDQEADYVYQRFVVNTDPDAWVCEINWRDNPWFGPEMDTERRKLKALNDDLYAHVWEGKPRSAAGLLFKRHWFKRFDLGDEPKVLNCYMASDYAVTDADDPDVDREPDWTEHGVFGIDQHADLWALDWWSGQTDPHVWIQAWLTLGRRNKILTAFEEAGVILRSQNAAINRAMKVANTYLHRESLPSAGKKAERALGFAARAAAGAVWIPNTEWGDRLINQLCAFNGQDGRTDDMVDVCSLLARGLDEMADPAPAAESGKPKPAAMTLDWLDRHDKQDAADAAQRARYYR